MPDEVNSGGEAAAIGDEVPRAGEAAQTLERGEVDQFILEYFVGRLGVIDHFPFAVVSADGGAAQAFEDADLDFVRVEGEEVIESLGETLERLPGQAEDEVGVEVSAGFLSQEAEVFFRALVVLPSSDSFCDLWIESLDTDFELERSRGELLDRGAERFGEAVRDHFKVEEQIRGEAVEEEVQERLAGLEIEVEGAVDELEMPEALIEEVLELMKQGVEGEGADGGVEGGQAELAGIRAAAGSFDIDDAVLDVLGGVEVVGEGEVGRAGELSDLDFLRGWFVVQELLAE